jgi:hypothetical protein
LAVVGGWGGGGVGGREERIGDDGAPKPREPGPLGSAGDNARTRRSGLDHERRPGKPWPACARERVGARAPQHSRLLGEGAHAPAAASYGDPGMCPGSSPPPFSARVDSVAAASPATLRCAALRASTGPQGSSKAALRAGAGRGSHTGVGRPLPPEGRRLRGRGSPPREEPPPGGASSPRRSRGGDWEAGSKEAPC